MEPTYPLHLRLCEACLLLQIPALITPEETFTEYAYFSSFSDSWVEHARSLREAAVERLGLDRRLVRGRGRLATTATCCSTSSGAVPVPRHRAVGERRRGGTRARRADPYATSWTSTSRREVRARARPGRPGGRQQRLRAHPRPARLHPRPCAALVADDGTGVASRCTTLSTWCGTRQFDTIYHEHFQYYTLLSASRALATGGPARWSTSSDRHARRLAARSGRSPDAVGGEQSAGRAATSWPLEQAAGLHDVGGVPTCSPTRTRDGPRRTCCDSCSTRRATVCGWPATARRARATPCSTTAASAPDLLAYTVDRNPYKHGRFTPGTRIPIHPPERSTPTGRTSCSCCRGTCAPSSPPQLGATSREWGGRLVFAAARPCWTPADPSLGGIDDTTEARS